MTWTKYDYEFFAEAIRNTPMSHEERIYLSNRFGKIFVADNSRFDWERWNDAMFAKEIPSRGRGGTAKHWTAKTYKMTAEVLSGPDPSIHFQYAHSITLSEDTRLALISAFGAAFERDNSNFDWDRFRTAAGSPYAPTPRCVVCGEEESSHPWEGTHKYGPTMHTFKLNGPMRREVRVRGHARRTK